MHLGVLQENLLVLLAFDDDKAKIIRGAVSPDLFGGPYRLIAARLYDYIDRFKAAPKEHLADIMMDKLEEKKGREGALYKDILGNIRDAAEGVNSEYIMSQLDVFIRRQSLRGVAIELAKALQKDTEESLEEADALMRTAQHQSLTLFDPGTRLSDKEKALKFLDRQDQCFPTGIPEFDKRGFGPTRKELYLFMSDTKKGKTWWLIQLAKMAAMHRLKVSHLSLEMGEDISAQRYLQTFFAMSKRREKFLSTKFKRDALNRIMDFEDVEVTPRITLQDDDLREQLERRLVTGQRVLQNIIIKQFPAGALTVQQYVTYLENLESVERFTPDLIIVDYPDLMKLDTDNYRLSIDRVYKDLRGLAVERNAALAVVSQSNRAGAEAKTLGRKNVAEAYSKIAHADCAITYSQTEAEEKLGLARLGVEAGRNDQGVTVVISQQYNMGTFVVDSCLMSGNYWGNVPKNGRDEEAEEE